MTRIAILSAQPHPFRGGPTIQHLTFLERLHEAGFDCHVALAAGHTMEAEYRSVAASVLSLEGRLTVPRSTSLSQLGRYSADLAATAGRIAWHARRVGARLVHTFGEGFLAGALGARLARLPSVVHIIGMSVFSPPWIARVYGRILDTTADALVACQSQVAEALRRVDVDASKVHVVYNSVEPEVVRERAALGPSVQTEPDTLRVGMVAGLDRRKGHLNFVRAAVRVCAEEERARFFVIGSLEGDREYLQSIERTISDASLGDRVRLVGPVERVEPWMASLDLFCVPSSTEGLTVAGIEAMALGRPVVATRVGGNPDLVGDGDAGLLCQAEDGDALAHAILRVLRDHELRSRLGAASVERADALFAAKVNTERLAALFRDLI